MFGRRLIALEGPGFVISSFDFEFAFSCVLVYEVIERTACLSRWRNV